MSPTVAAPCQSGGGMTTTPGRFSPITMDQDQVPPPGQGDHEYVIVVETADPGVTLQGSLEVYVEVIPAAMLAEKRLPAPPTRR